MTAEMKKMAEDIFKNIGGYMMGKSSEPYSDKVLTLAYEPLNVGEVENPSTIGKETGSCGDTIKMSIKVVDDIITEIKFLSDGCGATLASGSAVTELIKSKTPYEAGKLTVQDVLTCLNGLPASHVHCAVLAVKTLQKTLGNL